MWASFKEIGRVEIAAQSTFEFSLQNMTRVYFRQLLEQHLSNAKIASILWKLNSSLMISIFWIKKMYCFFRFYFLVWKYLAYMQTALTSVAWVESMKLVEFGSSR